MYAATMYSLLFFLSLWRFPRLGLIIVRGVNPWGSTLARSDILTWYTRNILMILWFYDSKIPQLPKITNWNDVGTLAFHIDVIYWNVHCAQHDIFQSSDHYMGSLSSQEHNYSSLEDNSWYRRLTGWNTMILFAKYASFTAASNRHLIMRRTRQIPNIPRLGNLKQNIRIYIQTTIYSQIVNQTCSFDPSHRSTWPWPVSEHLIMPCPNCLLPVL
jgi:hypothetical protein